MVERSGQLKNIPRRIDRILDIQKKFTRKRNEKKIERTVDNRTGIVGKVEIAIGLQEGWKLQQELQKSRKSQHKLQESRKSQQAQPNTWKKEEDEKEKSMKKNEQRTYVFPLFSLVQRG